MTRKKKQKCEECQIFYCVGAAYVHMKALIIKKKLHLKILQKDPHGFRESVLI
jgi:uncharacterized membrane protein YhfC